MTTAKNPRCRHRCLPPCSECIAGAECGSRGAPVENSFTRFESVWLAVFLCVAVVLYLSSKHLPSGWSLIGTCSSVPIALAGVLGPYQFRVYRQAKRVERGVCAGCGYTLGQLPVHDDGTSRRAFDLVACSECGLWNGRRRAQPQQVNPAAR